MLISVAVILSQFSMLGISLTLLRFFPYFNNKRARHHGFFSFTLLISMAGFILFSMVFILLKKDIVQFFEAKSILFVLNYTKVLPLAFLMVLFEMFFFYTRSLFKIVIPVAIREVILRIFQTFALVAYVIHWINFEGFLWLLVGSYLLQVIVIILYVAWLRQLHVFTKIDLIEYVPIPKLIRYSIFIFATSIASIFVANIDVILLSALSANGLADTAVYSVAFFVGTIIQVPGRTMNQVAIPIVADAWKNDDQVKLQQLYTQTSLTQLIIGGFIFLLIWINVNLLLSLLPPVYENAKYVILIVGLGKLFDLSTGINGEIILYSRHVKVGLVTNLLLIVLTTIADYLLIPRYGVVGAATATAIALVSYNIIRMIFLYARYHFQPFNKNTAKAAVLLLICLAAYYLLPSTTNLWINSIYQSFTISLLFILPLLMFKISPEIQIAFKSAFDWIKRIMA